jgi:FkbM family methyltransferase
MQGISTQLKKYLHRSNFLRSIAKGLFKGFATRQPFHGGVIYCDMVEHSWAWVHGPRYESFDRPLQDALLEYSRKKDLFIDIGCNVGAMTLSILLRNSDIKAICIDPNPNATALLEKSLTACRVSDRVSVIQAAVADREGVCGFEFEGSVTGHISVTGVSVPSKSIQEILATPLQGKQVLCKIDIEGFEVNVIPALSGVQNKQRLTLFLELHPTGFNGIGDPGACLNALRASGAVLSHLDGSALCEVNGDDFTQVIVQWY